MNYRVSANEFIIGDIFLFESDVGGPYPTLIPKSYSMSIFDSSTGIYSSSLPSFMDFDVNSLSVTLKTDDPLDTGYYRLRP